MADEIKITTSSPAGQQGGAQATAGQAQAQSKPKIPTDGPPVIDLRMLEAASAKMSASAPAPAPAAPTPASAPVPAQPKPLTATQTPGAINLEEAAMMASQTTVAPPQEKYIVPQLVKDKFPDLIDLVKKTESMNDEEREYWFQILPIMTEDQIRKFYDILLNEKKQLSHLDTQYEQELNKLNQKHLVEWKEFESKEKRKALQEAEQKDTEQEKSEQEDLLKRLSQI